MKSALILLLLLPFASAAIGTQKLGDSPETDMIIMLRGIAASCAYNDEFVSGYAYSEDPSEKKYMAESLKAEKCVADGLLKGKSFLQLAVAKSPGLKDQLVHVYSSWLTYMRSLSSFNDDAAHLSAHDDFEKAIDQLSAALDSRV